mgnify:FL=1|jgi:hypothetical protein
MKIKWGSKKTEKIVAKVVDAKSTKKTILPSNELLAANRDTDKVKAVDGNPTA